MKVILSRKGFDDQYGGHPSIILPNSDMISFPIPVSLPEKGIKAKALYYNNNTFQELFAQLNIKQDKNQEYHLDPDIRFSTLKNRDKNWIGSFGQSGAALGHLQKHNIEKDDIFLYYGTFNFTRNLNGLLNYEKSYPFHAIWGYLVIDQIIDVNSDILKDELIFLKAHPHYINRNLDHYKSGNKIFIGKKFGTFCFSESLRLTKIGYHKSLWELPNYFRDVNMTYHQMDNYEINEKNNNCMIQTVSKGQEFIFESDNNIEKWIEEIISNKSTKI